MNDKSEPHSFANNRQDNRPDNQPGDEKKHLTPTEVPIGMVIQAIHDCPSQLVLTIAGAGHSALNNLLDVAGASRTLLEALVPYSNAAFDDFLAYTPEQYVAPTTARLMAGRAYTRARLLTHSTAPVIGVGCTATIVTDRPKRGEHRAHIALRQHSKVTEYYLQLEKGKRDRHGEEAVVGGIIINAIAESFGVAQKVAVPLGGDDQLTITEVIYGPAIEALATRQVHFIGIQADGLLHPTDRVPPVILSGAFNPLHEGHLGMARAVEKMLGQRVTFELAAVNVDKPPLPAAVILERMGQFAGRYTVLASDAPTYIGKARLYPGTTFVVGYDTAVRIFAPRYYENSTENMIAALREIRDLGCDFLVAGRVDENNIFRSLEDLAIPAEFQPIFKAIPERVFRRDISSSELRAANEPGSR